MKPNLQGWLRMDRHHGQVFPSSQMQSGLLFTIEEHQMNNGVDL